MAKHLALFEGTDTAGKTGLWVTNGTAAGTSELTGISGANTSLGVSPAFLTAPVTSGGRSDRLWSE